MKQPPAARKRLLIAGGDLRQVTAAARLAERHTVFLTGFDRFGTLPPNVAAVQNVSALPDEADALILPMPVTASNRKKDIPANIAITVLLIFLGLEKTIFGFGTDGLSRLDGGILIAVFLIYMILSDLISL